jgi:hypothetical protein
MGLTTTALSRELPRKSQEEGDPGIDSIYSKTPDKQVAELSIDSANRSQGIHKSVNPSYRFPRVCQGAQVSSGTHRPQTSHRPETDSQGLSVLSQEKTHTP